MSRTNKPELKFWQIWNMCFGFLGIQFGFALQNANVSRIFQSLGASVDDMPVLWLAAPVTGLMVQPDHRLLERPDLGPPGPAAAVFPRRRHPRDRGAGRDAEQPVPLGGGRHAVDPGRLDQHLDGAVPRPRGRHAAGPPAEHRLRHAELVHRRRCGRGVGAALDPRDVFRRGQRGRAGRIAPVRQARVLPRRAGLLRRGAWTVLRTREYSPAQMRCFRLGSRRPTRAT